MYVIRKVSATGKGEKDNLHQPAIMTAPLPRSHPRVCSSRELAPELSGSSSHPSRPSFFVASGTLPPSVSTLQSVYDDHHDEDGFLYMTYSGENFFG